MPLKIKVASKVLIVEGPQQGVQGTVSKLERVFDLDDRTKRWTVWIDAGAGVEWRIRTRLSWVRAI